MRSNPLFVDTLIIGAGIVGCSTAYYLAELGNRDVLVIDKGPLFDNDGSTSHAPGGVNPLSNNTSMAQLAAGSINLFEKLPSWKPDRHTLNMVGGVDVARTKERMYEVKRLYTNGKGFGVEVHMIGPDEIEKLFPLMKGDEFLGGLYTPRKPVVAGAHVCGALAAEATKMAGTRFVGQTRATDFEVNNGRIFSVKTSNPEMAEIRCRQALLCTNIWTPALTEQLGISVPLMPAEHQYLKSAPLAALAHVSDRSDPDQEIIYPSVRDMDGGLYYRHWWDSVGMGSYHHRPIMVDSRQLGRTADHPFTPEDFADARQIAEASIPALRDVDYPYKINGMFSFSVDGLPILGESQIAGLWVAAAVWVTHSGGVGKAMAEWMTTGESEVDMRSLDINRFLRYQKTARYLHIACAKNYAEVHDIVHPAQWPSKPRNILHTPFYARHTAKNAVFTPSAGVEIPYWLGENQRLLEKYEDQVPDRSGWSAMYWSPIQGAEHLAMRESAGIIDLSTLAIIEIIGEEAQKVVDFVCTSRMDFSVGHVAYTLMCTPKGGIKRDVAVARLSEDRYWMFTGSGTLPLELAWLRRHSAAYSVKITDLTDAYGTLGLFGPRARDILSQITPADVSNDAFPLYSWQEIEIGTTPVYAQRISYVGELGWELYMSPSAALSVYDTIWEAGRPHDLAAVGVGAMRNMRTEKGYRLWGSDIHTEHNPYEAGMGWLVKIKKGDFIGRDALAALKKAGQERRLVTLTLDHPAATVTGNEPIFDNGRCIGQVTSGGYGYSIGRAIAFGYLPLEYAQPGIRLEVEYLAERYPAKVTADAVYDPQNERMKS